MARVRRPLAAWEAHLEEAIGVEDASAVVDVFDRHVSRHDLERALADQSDRLLAALEASEQRLSATFERRIADAVTSQTRTLVLSQLTALVAIAALAFGLR